MDMQYGRRPMTLMDYAEEFRRFSEMFSFVVKEHCDAAVEKETRLEFAKKLKECQSALDDAHKACNDHYLKWKKLEAENEKLKGIVINRLCESSPEDEKSIYTERVKQLELERDEARALAQKYRDEYEGMLSSGAVASGENDLSWEHDDR